MEGKEDPSSTYVILRFSGLWDMDSPYSRVGFLEIRGPEEAESREVKEVVRETLENSEDRLVWDGLNTVDLAVSQSRNGSGRIRVLSSTGNR